MLKQMGITSEEVDGVEEVIIRTHDEEWVIKGAAVTMMKVQGQTMFQVVGEPRVGPRSSAPAGVAISEEDVRLVAEKAGVSEERARQALVEANGEPAEAIIRLMGG
jgi:nascent polypeptide-associated complex subunit alpha